MALFLHGDAELPKWSTGSSHQCSQKGSDRESLQTGTWWNQWTWVSLPFVLYTMRYSCNKLFLSLNQLCHALMFFSTWQERFWGGSVPAGWWSQDRVSVYCCLRHWWSRYRRRTSSMWTRSVPLLLVSIANLFLGRNLWKLCGNLWIPVLASVFSHIHWFIFAGYYTRSGYVPGPICKYNWTKVWDAADKVNSKLLPKVRWLGDILWPNSTTCILT